MIFTLTTIAMQSHFCYATGHLLLLWQLAKQILGGHINFMIKGRLHQLKRAAFQQCPTIHTVKHKTK